MSEAHEGGGGVDRKAKSAALDRVLELAVLVNEDMNRTLPQDGLTPSRAHLLWELLHRGPSTQRVLADALRVSARTITGLIDGLAATGFVTREPHPADRRATLVTFTQHGQAVADKMRKDQHLFADILFDGMPGERFDGLVEGLDDVLDRLRKAMAQQ
jgi:DNA-binding MarR family transcriptional regulator